MSKAFVKETESADDGVPEAVEESPAKKNYISPAGYARLKSELKTLVETERPAVVQSVAWAASNGDRSENGDYIYGKRRLREIDRRVRFLIRRLENAEVVDAAGRSTDQVYFGASVTVRSPSGDVRVFTIVGIDEVDAARGRVSWISPIAKAVLKSRIGDTVVLRTPAGDEPLEVLDARYARID